jgi:hypothetical protein
MRLSFRRCGFKHLQKFDQNLLSVIPKADENVFKMDYYDFSSTCGLVFRTARFVETITWVPVSYKACAHYIEDDFRIRALGSFSFKGRTG